MILVGGAGGRVRIEYLKSRRSLRVWVGDKNEGEPIDLTLDEFFERLAIERHLLVGDRCFLLFAGPLDAPRGGGHDLVGVFRCESEAREAFMALRRTRPPEAGWGQLVAIDERSSVRMLAWFGTTSGPATVATCADPCPPPAPEVPDRAAQAVLQSRARSWAAARRRLGDEHLDRAERLSGD